MMRTGHNHHYFFCGRRLCPAGSGIAASSPVPDQRKELLKFMNDNLKENGLPQARVATKNPYLVMMGLYLGAFMGMFSETSLNIALPALSSVFQVDTAVTQWMVVGYMLVIGLVLPFVSLLMKWFSVRKLTVFALGAFFAGALVSGFAPDFTVLLLGRVMQGIGTGIILPIMFAMVLEVFPPHKIGSAMGLTALIIMFAPAVGPTLSGLILSALSWRWLFFLFAVVLGVALFFAWRYLVDPYELTRPSIDVISCVASCVGFGGIVLGAGLASLYGWLSLPVLCCLILGIVVLLIYIKRQLSMDVPVLDLRAFQIPQFRIGAILVMVDFGITLSSMYLLPQFIQNGMLLPVGLTGIIMLPGGVVNALVSLGAGRLYDKIGAGLPVKIGFSLSVIGAVLLLFADQDSQVFYVILCHILLMIGVPLAMSPSQSSGLNSLPPKLSTDGSTILNTMQQVLGAVCTAVATSLLGIGQRSYLAGGGADSAAAFTYGVHYGVVFTLVLAVIGLLISFRIRTRKDS